MNESARRNNFCHNGEAASDYRAIWGCVMTEHSIKHYIIMESCMWNATHAHRHYIQKSLQAHGVDISVKFE